MDTGPGDEWYSGICALVDAAARDMAAMPHSQHSLESQPGFQSMLLEFALSAKIISPDHPAVASLTRLLLRSTHLEHAVPPEMFDSLKAFGVTKQVCSKARLFVPRADARNAPCQSESEAQTIP